MKCSRYYFYMKTKILADFQIFISVPLRKNKKGIDPKVNKIVSCGKRVEKNVSCGKQS